MAKRGRLFRLNQQGKYSWRVSPDAAFLDFRSPRLLQNAADLQQTRRTHRVDAGARHRQTRPIPLMFGNFATVRFQASGSASFFLSQQRPITARKQRNNSGGTAKDRKHFGRNSIRFGSAGRVSMYVLYLFSSTPMSSLCQCRVCAVACARARDSRRSAQRRKRSFRTCRWAGRISLRPWFDAVWPRNGGRSLQSPLHVKRWSRGSV